MRAIAATNDPSPIGSIDDIDNFAGYRVDENYLVVDDRVAIGKRHPELARNRVKGDTFGRQYHAYRDRFTKSVGRSVFAHNIITEARTLVDAVFSPSWLSTANIVNLALFQWIAHKSVTFESWRLGLIGAPALCK